MTKYRNKGCLVTVRLQIVCQEVGCTFGPYPFGACYLSTHMAGKHLGVHHVPPHLSFVPEESTVPLLLVQLLAGGGAAAKTPPRRP